MTAADPQPNERLIVAIARERAHGRYMHHIAAEIGVHPSLLSRWAYGHRELPAHHARALAAALHCGLEDITDDERPGGDQGARITTSTGSA